MGEESTWSPEQAVEYGRRRDGVFHDGAYHDEIVTSVLATDGR